MLRSAQSDKERLDWLEKERRVELEMATDVKGGTCLAFGGGSIVGTSLREAIDKAMGSVDKKETT